MSYEDIFDRYIHPLLPAPTGLNPEGKLTGPIHAIFFDIYGTLFVSHSGDIQTLEFSPERRQALGRLLEDYGLFLGLDDTLERFVNAIKAEHRRQIAFGTDYPEVQIDRIWMDVLATDDIETVRRFATAFELIVNPVYPMPHLENLLLNCNRGSLELGIISNAQFFTPLLFERFCGHLPEQLGFDKDLLLYSYRVGCAKPSPVLFQTAVRRLYHRAILPRSVLYVGNDMRNDIWPARQAGFQTALFAGDKRSLRLREEDPECRKISPDLIITELDQLADHLKIAAQ